MVTPGADTLNGSADPDAAEQARTEPTDDGGSHRAAA
jgi:hypothetical protein